MLKKLLTSCLTIAAAAALAVPAMAADMSGKIGGRAVAELISSSNAEINTTTGVLPDATKKLDMASHGRLDYTLTATEGDWTVTGKIEMRSNLGEEAYDRVQILQKYAKLENDAFSVSLGTQWWSWFYLTPYMGDTIDRNGYGHGAATGLSKDRTPVNLRDDRLIVGIKNVGLQIMYQTNYKDGYDWTGMGAQFDKTFGPVTLAASYNSMTGAANVEGGGAEDSTNDGATWSSIALGIQYAISEGMFVEFDYETETNKAGYDDAESETGTQMGLAFTMALSEVQGFTVAYDQITFDDGVMDDPSINTLLTFNFVQMIAGQKFWVGYNSSVTTNAGIDDNLSESTELALGARVSF